MKLDIIAAVSANYFARAVSSILSLIFIPVYIKLLGIESFALIGIYTSLTMWFFLLDLGMGQSMMREFARYTAGAYELSAIKNLSFSVEVTFMVIVAILLSLFYLFVKITDAAGINAQTISRQTISICLYLMSLAIAFRMLGTLYRRSLVGLQKQITANSADVLVNILRYSVTVCTLLFYKSNIVIFFICQVAVSVFEVILYKALLAHSLPSNNHKSTFQPKLLLSIWRYSFGAGAMAILTISLTQADKIFLVQLVSLEQFGYYSIAYTIASALALLSIPITSGLHPKLAQLYSANELVKLNDLYRYGSRTLIMVLVPSALVMSLFSTQLLTLWQQNVEAITHASHITSILILAQMSWLLSVLNQDFQLAHGQTRLLVYCQIVAVAVLLPALYYSSSKWGIMGAGFTLLIVNSFYSIILNYLGHRRWIPELKFKWYSHYLIPTLMVTVVVVSLVKFLYVGIELNLVNSLLQIVMAMFVSLVAAIMLGGELRELIFCYCKAIIFSVIKQVKFNLGRKICS